MTDAPPQRNYTPAAGNTGELARYDALVREYTREDEWRPLMVARIDPHPGQTIVDIGSGTETLAVALKRRCPRAEVIAIDPDPEALAIGKAKADAAGVEIDWRQGFADGQRIPSGSVDHAVCSLVLHQVPLHEKQAILGTMKSWTAGRGTIYVADYGRQRGTMRQGFAQPFRRAMASTIRSPMPTARSRDFTMGSVCARSLGTAISPRDRGGSACTPGALDRAFKLLTAR